MSISSSVAETSGPHSLISVCVPAVGSTTAVDVRDSCRDADEVVEDRLGGQLLDDPRPGPSAREAGRDDGHLEDLQRPRDVDPLAACEREHLARAMAEPDLEDGDGQRAVERRVRRHRDDHVTISHRFRTVCVAYHCAFAQSPASATDSAATRFDDATSRLPSYTSTRPSCSPFAMGSASAVGADDALDERATHPNGARDAARGDELDVRLTVRRLGLGVDTRRVDHPHARYWSSPYVSSSRSASLRVLRESLPRTAPYTVVSPRRAAAACDQPAARVCPVFPADEWGPAREQVVGRGERPPAGERDGLARRARHG